MLESSTTDDCIQKAIRILRDGGIVALPTDTVYGVAASVESPEAIRRLYRIKRRDRAKPIPLLISSYDALRKYTTYVPKSGKLLARRFWPGALTIVVAASERVPREVLSGTHTVGLRMPDNAATLAVIRGLGGVLAVTSANVSGESEATSADEVIDALGNEVDFILDGGKLESSMPSTVVDVTVSPNRILRDGAIGETEIRAVLGERT